jgi:hypothetical protein
MKTTRCGNAALKACATISAAVHVGASPKRCTNTAEAKKAAAVHAPPAAQYSDVGGT